jgi:gamma-glutamylcyclotransferase (GGCT)/AIG2-like uncharacterized protein YtfP
MHYFAYGSNLSWRQMRGRCPSARFVCRAVLPDYRIAFTRYSPRRRSGAADVVHAPGQSVWGVVYHLPEDDLRVLDGWEGFEPGRAGNAYDRIVEQVRRDGRPDDALAAWTYVVCDKRPEPQVPSVHYRSLMIEGALHWGLPASYVDGLRGVPAVEVPMAVEPWMDQAGRTRE